MKVIITMAGAGSRFREAGIEEIKYKLQIKDRSMFEFAMQSLQSFFDHHFVFITQESHDATSFLDEKCENIGIDEYDIVELTELTSGQATTALQAEPYVSNDDSIIIYNIDTFVEPGTLKPTALAGDGCIPVFETDGGSWSYVKTGADGRVIDVAEKEEISSLASIGLYHFERWGLFRAAFENLSSNVEKEYGERYIAPLYNWLIDSGHLITVHRIPKERVHILGTPSDVSEFDSTFPMRYDLE